MSLAQTSTARIEVSNPVTGEIVGSVVASSADQVAATVAATRAVQGDWNRLGFAARARLVRRFAALLDSHQGELLDTLQDETGKTRRDALSEVLTVARTCQYYSRHGGAFLADTRSGGALPGIGSARVTYKPHGVVGFISPWNYPLILTVGDAIPALLAGNSVVIKPSEHTPLSALLAVDLLRRAGVPEEVMQLVNGYGEVGGELIRQVDYISFTGSSATGRKIAVAAGERLLPYSLELGGKNPLIVLAGAPVEQAVEGFVSGAFFNAGQTCIAVERAFIERPIYDEFVSRAIARTAALRLGWAKDWTTDMGSLINVEHADKVMHHIDDARQRGAEVLTGGGRRPDLGPAFVEPTLLEGVDEAATLHAEETFGPVVALHPVADKEEAIERANDTPYGLNASVWGPDGATSLAVARQLDTGSTTINAALMIYHCFDVPMGGVKQSGIGRRHGRIGIQRFTQAQSIVSAPMMSGGYDSILGRVRSARAARWLTRLFGLLGKVPGLR